ncbi:TerB N-terminal domain-containing protein [Rhizobium sp. 18065]|uniref:TerB N-terminal domain-containing protein n=1 Tax=Rhizobium sp. 18065 TaxID=2681411 RepID=UPI0013598193|nr:TerB N-terminal domain-containing protein [Rhizobium sp. 18065]
MSLIVAAVQPFPSVAQTVSQSISEVQLKLQEQGYNPGVADGIWGKKSINALKAFQRANGLSPSGVADESVLAVMFPEAPVATPDIKAPSTSPVTGRAVETSPLTVVPTGDKPTDRLEPQKSAAVGDLAKPPTLALPAIPTTAADKNVVSEPTGSGVYVVLAIGALILFVAFRRKKKTKPPAQQPEAGQVAGKLQWPDKSHGIQTVIGADKERLVEGQRPAQPPTTIEPAQRASHLTLHNAATWGEPRSPTEAGQSTKPFFGTLRRADGAGALGLVSKANTASVSPNWLSVGMMTSVGGVSVHGGLIYVGSYLPKQNSSQENENCLINPKLAVAKRGDPNGLTMGYWPSYSQMTPEARKSYLDWLGGTRSDPATYIGYVFLYLYGLERRLMLENDVPDADIVFDEVRRLIGIYGSNNSFYRYAHELLSAYQIKAQPLLEDFIPDVDGNGYEVPNSIKMALGLRVRDGRAFEPELLLKFAMSHPETRVRTPARRSPDLLKQLFDEELASLHPSGFRIKGGKFKMLKATYRACSGSFTVDVLALGGSVPDVSGRAEPITTARRIFDACTDKLDEYSRALGRSPGMLPTLSAISKLPPSQRSQAAQQISGGPLETMECLASQARPVKVGELLTSLDFEVGVSIGKSKLREMSQILSAFGYGNTADPTYALKLVGADDPVLVFRSEAAVDVTPSPSLAYRSVQLSLMLGMLIGYADAHLNDSEYRALLERADAAPGLTADERLRLKSELRLSKLDPERLDEWAKRLKDVPEAARSGLATELVAVAAADGTLHAKEVKKLETLFKRMGLDQQTLYHLLHESGSSRQQRPADDDLSFVVEPDSKPTGVPIPPPPSQPTLTRIDVSRLNAIRSETRVTASVLETIFAEDEGVTETISLERLPVPEESDLFEGLERRYGFLVSELSSSPTWTSADFESLVRAAGLMPGAARDAINEWSMDHLDDLLIEGEDPIAINVYLLPANIQTSGSASISEGISA